MKNQKSGKTRDRILAAASDLFSVGGLDAVTFDAVAEQLGLTKQAVLYWFPSKVALLSALALPSLRGEAAAAIDAAVTASNPSEAAAAVVRAVTQYHLEDLARFRLIYLSPQIGVTPGACQTAGELVKQVHPITSEMYAAVAAAIGDGPTARETAVALHMAALGHALMVALTDAIGDPLRHVPERLADRLTELVATGAREQMEDPP